MFCKNCGKEIDDNAVICPNCGVATQNAAAQQAAAMSAPVEEKKKTNVFAIIGFILTFVAGIIVWFSGIVSIIIVIAALVLSILGIVWANKKNANLKGLAIAGVVLSALSLLFDILFIFVIAAFIVALM